MKKILFILAAMLLSSVGLHAEKTITYTASERLFGYNGSLNEGATTFGPAITSHEFSNGKGTITCAGVITKIGEHAFYSCDKMTSITIPNSVTDIERDAFGFCTGLTSVTIPNAVEGIGETAFMNCNKLTSVTIGDSVSVIRTCAFESCSSLNTIYCYAPTPPVLGPSVFNWIESNDISVYVFDVEKYRERWGTQLSPSCFKPITAEVGGIKYEIFDGNKARVVAKEGGYTQSSIIIPEQVTYQDRTFTVTEIGHDAFMNCSTLTSIIIPNTVTDIVHGAFQKCSELISIEIPDPVTRIGNGAFDGCSKLSSINIPNSVKEIGDGAFLECYSLESITIPASVNKIGFGAFKNCTSLKDLQFADRTDTINICNYAFENMALKKVIIPKWMKEIPQGLFYKNSKLEAIYLPATIEKINYRPFGSCPLKYIFSVSQTPPILAEGAFEGHDKDANVIVYVPSQDAKVAYQNSDWSKYFTNFVTDIEYRIISTSDKTAEVVSAIPFEGTVSIPGTTILDGTYYNVIGIGDRTFEYNDSLTSISLSPTLKYIGNDAFNECKGLKKIQLPEDLQTIGDRAFYHTPLDSIVIPEGVQSLGKSAFSYSILKYVSLPTGLKNISDECFYRCPLGTEIIVPEGVDTIGTRGFAYFKNLVSMKDTLITLPSTLKGIKDSAFQNRNGLKEVICLAQEPPTLGVNVFTNTDTAIVYVPNRDVLGTYRDNSLWKNYKFKFDDLMAKTNKAYLYEVAGNNKEAQGIAQQYCDSIDKATTAAQVEFFTNKALALIDPYTLNDYKGRLADTLESIANTCPDSAAKLIALGIAAEYRNKIMLAIFRQDAEKIFAEGLAKINEVFELVELKKTCCNNLRISARGLGEEIETIAEDFCKQINNAITKEEVNKIYKEGSQVIARYTYINFYWSGSPDEGCQTTKGYYDKGDK